MEDIRLFGNDGDYLILEALDGQKFRLMSDDTLRSAMKRENHSKLDAVSLTPREIQDHIRNGMSIDDITTLSGAPYDFVEKFAAPVLDELAHMVDSAKSVRITTSQDRYSDVSHVEFGQLVESRLTHGGGSSFVWTAKRGEFNTWNISVSFMLDDTDSFASWAFDPRKLTLSPENESAVSLSTNDPLTSTPIPKLRPVLMAEPNSSATEVLDTVVIETFSPESDEPQAPKAKESAPWITAARSAANLATAEEPVPQSAEPDQPLSATADLLQALRIKRGEREAAAEVSKLRETSDVVEAPKPEQTAEVVASEETAEVAPATLPKKGRVAMPSWDQIVFGTKTED